MKLLLLCGSGISTGVLASLVRHYASDGDEIEAAPADAARPALTAPDVVLVAPYMRHRINEIRTECEKEGIFCDLIHTELYEGMDGEGILKQARYIFGRGKRQEEENGYQIILQQRSVNGNIDQKDEKLCRQ